jgi:hypothetical protein
MVTKEEMIKGLNALEDLIAEQNLLRTVGLIFIFERGLWDDFMKYHSEQHLERTAKK